MISRVHSGHSGALRFSLACLVIFSPTWTRADNAAAAQGPLLPPLLEPAEEAAPGNATAPVGRSGSLSEASPESPPVPPQVTTAAAPQSSSPLAEVLAPQSMSRGDSSPALAPKLVIDGGNAAAEIRIDGLTVGRGVWNGALSVGRHRVEALRSGFDTETFEIDVSDPRTVVIAPSFKPAVSKRYVGLGIRAGLSGLTGSAANQITSNCPSLSGCSTSGPWGGSLEFRVNYSAFRWLAPELTLLGFLDVTNVATDFPSASTYDQSRFYGPARTENYTFLRYGWFMGVGARVSTQTVPVSVTGGVSLGTAATTAQFTKIAMTSGNFQADPSKTLLPGEQHRTSPSQTLYNPALSIDAAAAIGSAEGVRAYLGVQLLATFSDRQLLLAGENSTLGMNPITGAGDPYGMPNVTASRRTTIYVGPSLGFVFGI